MRNLLIILLIIGVSLAWIFYLYPLVRKSGPQPYSIITSNQYVTNWLTFTNPPAETDYQQGLRAGEEIGFKDGVFWGSFACFRGSPTNMLDAETIAYRMRREAISDWEAHKRGMTNQ